jgi:hypothetical protein
MRTLLLTAALFLLPGCQTVGELAIATAQAAGYLTPEEAIVTKQLGKRLLTETK